MSANMPPIDLDRPLQHVVNELQGSPGAYKRFGIWWWPLKLILRHMGLFPQIPGLRSIPRGKEPYIDPEQSVMVPQAGVNETLAAALEEYGFNAKFGRNNGEAENPDGEVVVIRDPDMPV